MTADFCTEDHDERDDLSVDFVFDPEETRLACICTEGLWRKGLPELYLRPPESRLTPDAVADARLPVFLADGMIRLGQGLLASDGFDVPPYRTRFDGRPVRFWLGVPETPPGPLADHLDTEVDTVIRVHCSLWDAALLGEA